MTKGNAERDTREMTALRSAELTDPLPREVLLVPWGEVNSANGTFVLDEEAAQAVIEAFAAHGTDIPIDYEHQTLGGSYASPSGRAPAAGWVKQLSLKHPSADGNAGLYATVEWTEPARAQLAAREYRYLSPVAMVRKCDRKVVSLHSAALTNKPAIVGMRPIVNRMAEAVGQLREQLGLDAQADTETVVVAACERVTALTDAARRNAADSHVLAAMEAGKLTESQREWALALAMRDPAEFAAWQAVAPVVVSVGRLDAPTRRDTEDARGDRERIVAKARAEYRSHPELAELTSEAAFLSLALREAGVVPAARERVV